MLSIVRTGTKNIGAKIVGLHKVTKANNVFLQQVAFISRKENLADLPPRPAPFPYRKRNFNYLDHFLENTPKRFYENTRLIVVEGSIGVGKDKFCRELAEELNMVYFPPLTFDDVYACGSYGVDLRDYDDQLPVNIQTYDLSKFLKQPNHINAATFQLYYYALKFDRYCDALIHLMSTGDGVIIQRSPYSDFAFVEAMNNAGYLSNEAKSYYYDMTAATLQLLVKPHVIIYLDVPAEKCLENIKKRGRPDEVNSEVFTLDYLKHIENQYKYKFFHNMEEHCYFLTFNWSEDSGIDYVIDNLEALTFQFLNADEKLADWDVIIYKMDWTNLRRLYSPFNRELLLHRLVMPRMDVKELIMSGDESLILKNLHDTLPGYRYDSGYDPEYDKNYYYRLFSMSPYENLRSLKTMLADNQISQHKAIK